MLFIDVGAHVGNYAEGFARCPGVTDVFCFEPNPVNIQRLRDRFAHNGVVHIIQKAVGLVNGTIELFRYNGDVDNNPDNTGRSSIFPDNKNVAKDKFYTVEIIRLSDFLKDNGITYVDCLKIDTEGAEYDILEDLMNAGVINNIRQIILSEHRFLFGDEWKQRAEAVMQRFKQEFKGIYLDEG